MNFFTSHDWLNRNLSSYAFQIDHILFIVFIILIGIAASLLLRNKSRKTISIVLISLWILYIFVVSFFYGFFYYQAITNPEEHPFNVRYMLPLHSCCMFMFVFPFAIFPKNRIIKTAASSFLVIVNMIMGFITLFVGCPPVGYSALSFQGVTSLIYHAIDVIVPLIMIVTKYYDIKKNDYRYGVILFLLLALIIWLFDLIMKCDYFYIYDGSTFPVLKVISENVPPIVWTLITVSSYVITALCVHFMVIGIKYLIQKKQNNGDNV